MKKYINISFIYAIAAMICGVFYREFTKFNGFTQKTTLSICHFKYFMISYNIGLPFMTIMFLIRGIIQVLNIQLSTGMNAAIAGIAGISHIMMGISIILLFLSMKQMTVHS